MSESLETFSEIKKIRFHLDSLDAGQEVLIRAHKQTLLKEILPEFEKSKEKCKVYLAINNERTGNKVAESLGIKPQNVSRQITWLRENALIEVNHALSGTSLVYKKTKLDKILGISKTLIKMGYSEPPQATDNKAIERDYNDNPEANSDQSAE